MQAASKTCLVLMVALILILLLLVPAAMPARQLSPQSSWLRRAGKGVDKTAGSRLPDCSHACGACGPCRLVMVRLFCESVEESETCPLAYKCICAHKSFPVP